MPKQNRKFAQFKKSAAGVKVENKSVAECVQKLNAVAEEGLKGWLEMGRIVAEFVAAMKSDPTFGGDAYRALARHDSCVHKASQLRNYHAAYLTYNKFSGEQYPNLTVTHYIALLTGSINLGERERLLQKANDETLSIKQLKEEIAKLRLPKKVQHRTWDGQCKQTASLSARLLNFLSSLHDMRSKMESQPELPENLTVSLATLGKYMADHFGHHSNQLESAPGGSNEAVHA